MAKRKRSYRSRSLGNTPARRKTASSSGITVERAAIYTMGIAAMGYGGYRLFRELEKSKAPASIVNSNPLPASTSIPHAASSRSAWTEGTFPVKYGSRRNNKVVRLQEALLAKGGQIAQFIRTTGGVDGAFGNGLKSALTAAGYGTYSTSVPDFIYYQIVGSQAASALPVTVTASSVPTVSYQAVSNDYFAQNRYATALVDTVLYTRPDRTAPVIKTIAAGEFVGIHSGKSVDTIPGDASSRWALVHTGSQNGWVFSRDIRSSSVKPAGLAGITLTAKTLFPITVRGERGETFRVAQHTILGEETAQKGGIARIRTLDNRTIFAPAAALEYV